MEELETSQKYQMIRSLFANPNSFQVLSSSLLINPEEDFTYKIDLKVKENEIMEYWCHVAFKLIQSHPRNECEYSQAHFFFWDTIERCCYFLNSMVEMAKSEMKIDENRLRLLLENPLQEGKGNWNMLFNIINKYGLLPKKCFPMKLDAQLIKRLNEIVQSKLRQYSKVIRDVISPKSSAEQIQSIIDEQTNEIYQIIAVLFGTMPEKLKWEYNDTFNSTESISSVEFYKKFVKSRFNIDDKLSLISDPRMIKTNQVFFIDNIGVVGGRQTLHNNQKIDVLIDAINSSISNGEPVLATCYRNAINDLQLYVVFFNFN